MIQIKNLSFGYHRAPVFKNISLEFEPGNIYGLLGENGVGKTTMLKLMCGLLNPQEGSCYVDSFRSADRLPQMLQEVCMLPDEMDMPMGMTPFKHIKSLMPFYPKASLDTFTTLMQELSVDPMKKYKEMSFGQQKKSLIAVYLSLGTKYVLFDEPTNGLDIPSKAEFRAILSRYASENTCIIISTHQVRDVENLIDPIIILTQDDVLMNASMQKISEKLSFTYDPIMQQGAFYSEPRPGGFLNVMPNTEGLDTQVDIEALFNAVLRNTNAVKNLFNE